MTLLPVLLALLGMAVPALATAACPDADGDAVCDADDNCAALANPDQRDTDLDGFGSDCDSDFTGDGLVGLPDFGPLLAAFGSLPGDPNYDPHVDTDGGGVGVPDFASFHPAFGKPPGPSGLACAGRVPCTALPEGPLAVLVIGDSISVGSDDEPIPDDSCEPIPTPNGLGWRGLLLCQFPEISFGNYTNGGWTSHNGLARLDLALDAFPAGNVALLSLHVNDCAPAGCGRVCSGGTRDGLLCVDGSDCAGGFCDVSNAHPCTPAETRDNLRGIVDELLDRGYQKVLFWKTPGLVGPLEKDHPCALGQFGFGPDTIDRLFLVDHRPTGFADEPRVAYTDALFRDFCPGTGLAGCDPDDGQGDRRAWWFSVDTGSGSHLHPNAWGYMAMGARLGQFLTTEPLNLRPPRPVVSVTDLAPDSISIEATAGPDPDGDAVTIYAWAVPASRECGVTSAADHDGDGRRDLVTASPAATLAGLAPATDYRICAVAYDGLQGSYVSDTVVAQTQPD